MTTKRLREKTSASDIFKGEKESYARRWAGHDGERQWMNIVVSTVKRWAVHDGERQWMNIVVSEVSGTWWWTTVNEYSGVHCQEVSGTWWWTTVNEYSSVYCQDRLYVKVHCIHNNQASVLSVLTSVHLSVCKAKCVQHAGSTDHHQRQMVQIQNKRWSSISYKPSTNTTLYWPKSPLWLGHQGLVMAPLTHDGTTSSLRTFDHWGQRCLMLKTSLAIAAAGGPILWEWVRVSESEWEWVRVSESEWEWVRVSESEWVSESRVSEWEWVRVSESEWASERSSESLLWKRTSASSALKSPSIPPPPR